MNNQETLKATGELTIVVKNDSGEVKQTLQVPNMVVTTGKNFISSRMKDATATAMSHMAIGTGNSAPAIGNTTLGTEVGRAVLTSTIVTNNTIQYGATFAAGVGGATTVTIAEAGIFNASSAGTMLCRTTFPVVNKAAGDTIAITWTVTIS